MLESFVSSWQNFTSSREQCIFVYMNIALLYFNLNKVSLIMNLLYRLFFGSSSGMLYLRVYKTCDLRSISLWLCKPPPSVESALVYKQDHVRREALYQGGFPIKEPHRSSSISKAGEKVSYNKAILKSAAKFSSSTRTIVSCQVW